MFGPAWCVQTLILMCVCLHLSHQVGTECTKYGTVADVCIFEVITPGYPPEEAVRIFVKFERVEAATRALVDLQGRFFGGRQVGGGSVSRVGGDGGKGAQGRGPDSRSCMQEGCANCVCGRVVRRLMNTPPPPETCF